MGVATLLAVVAWASSSALVFSTVFDSGRSDVGVETRPGTVGVWIDRYFHPTDTKPDMR